MGIQGLTSFIRNSDRYLQNYELHDTYLVIDGSSVACQLSTMQTKSHYLFGGEYDAFAETVSRFFDNLLKCNVTPLVLLDGGIENKKLRTVTLRVKEKIRSSINYCPSQQGIPFFSLLEKKVFVNVMVEKGIRFVKCLFEADDLIALLAKMLDCPVLSFDSDYFIYGSLYIPFVTLDDHVTKCSMGKGYTLHCQIYRIESLLKAYQGLTESMLPLASILLGNDYVKRGTFQNFFHNIKLHKTGRSRHSNQHYRIGTVLTWLSRQSLNASVFRILSRQPKERRKKMLKIIEENMNSSMHMPAEVLLQLGLSEQHIVKTNSCFIKKPFKFNGDIYDLTNGNGDISEEDSQDAAEEEELEAEIQNMLIESMAYCANKCLDALPSWFIHEFRMAEFSSYFIDLITRGVFNCPVQIEDYASPSSVLASQTILAVIYRLLVSGLQGKKKCMSIMIRDTNKLVCHQLEQIDSSMNLKYPQLAELREVPLLARKEIINNTLGIKDTCINQLPAEWRFYIACIKYWIEHTQLQLYNPGCYVYSLLVCMIFHIIDEKIGRHRVVHSFQTKYEQTVSSILQTRKASNYRTQEYSADVLTSQLRDNVTVEDSLLAAPFFLQQFQFNQKLCSNPKKYNKAIIHAFAEFQNCVYYCQDLNALLGYPYTQPIIHHLYNGTFLYNLYSKLNKSNDAELYIANTLQKSPSLLVLFESLLAKVKLLLPDMQWDFKQKRKKRYSAEGC